jgi:hypothetical protein
MLHAFGNGHQKKVFTQKTFIGMNATAALIKPAFFLNS